MRKTSTRSILPQLTFAGLVVLFAACADDVATAARRIDKDATGFAGRPIPPDSPAGAAPEAAIAADAAAPSVGMLAQKAETKPSSSASALPDVTAATNMVIRNGNASVLVDSLELAIVRVTQMAARLGGFVANTQIQSGHEQVPTATIELKLPAVRFEQASNELAPLGKVEFVNTTVEDVGEEFVDVTARMTNARHLEDRLVELLARRTGKLQEVLTVERELARVREEIERYEGRLRFLRSRVAMSTLTITVHEKAPIVSSNPDENVLGTALAKSWRNFVYFLAALIAALGWIIPLSAILVTGVVVGRRVLSGRQSAAVAPKQA